MILDQPATVRIPIPKKLGERLDRILEKKIQNGEVKNKEEFVRNILASELLVIETGDKA